MTLEELKSKIRNGLIVSCQAGPGSPLSKPDIIAAFAIVAEQNGAAGVRIDSPKNIMAVKRAVSLPVIGIHKIVSPNSEVYITPTFEAAKRIADAGADIIALDATLRLRPGGEQMPDIVERIRTELGLPVMADLATFDEGQNAERIGFDFLGTTLSGYTSETQMTNGPDLDLTQRLSSKLSVPVICEGRLRKPADVVAAFEAGAFAVVVGNAITGTDWLVNEFVSATLMASSVTYS